MVRNQAHHRPRHLALSTLSALLGLPMIVAAQSPLAAPRADPLDAQARVPAPVHASAFAEFRGLRGLREVPVGSWREANDQAARIGGWRAYARETSQPDAPSAAPPPKADR